MGRNCRDHPGKQPVANQIQYLTQLGVALEERGGTIAAVSQRLNLRRGVAEHEEAVGAHLAADLDIGSVLGADREGAVHAELHVPRTGGLHARG